jgi:ATP-dependent exoDNAse (exonuclease V) alpha subunit
VLVVERWILARLRNRRFFSLAELNQTIAELVIFLVALYRAEREIAETLKRLVMGEHPWPAIDVDKAIPWVEQRTRLVLADSQKAALRVALASNVTVISGGPGVGKTTLVNSLLKILIAKAVRVALCAPTGRAAKRLSESTGLGGEDHSSPPRNRSQDGRVPAQRGSAARLRCPGCGRDLDG